MTAAQAKKEDAIALSCNCTSTISVDFRYTGDPLQFHMVFSVYYVLLRAVCTYN